MNSLILHILFIILRVCLVIAFVYTILKIKFTNFGVFTKTGIIPLFLLVSFLLLQVFRNLIFFGLTKFTKNITVKKTYVSDIDKDLIPNYILIDSNNNLYEIVNMPWLLDFNKNVDFGKLVPGNKVVITGYSYHLPLFSHPYVYNVN